MQIDVYDSRPVGEELPSVSLNVLADAVDMPLPKGTNSSDANMMGLMVTSESAYNRYLDFRGMDRIDLGEDGYLILSDLGESVNKIYDADLSRGVTIELGGRTLRPAAESVNADASSLFNSSMGSNSGTVVVPDEVLDAQPLPALRELFPGRLQTRPFL